VSRPAEEARPDESREREIPISDYDYPLPPGKIAQEPVTPRDASRLMVLRRRGGGVEHHRFRDLPDLLDPGDLLVLNDTRVFPARMVGRKPTGGRIEFLFLRPGPEAGTWEALCDSARKMRPGLKVDFGEGLQGRVSGRSREAVLLAFPGGTDVPAALERRGRMPLPPYIHRDEEDSRRKLDAERYQTIFARSTGAVAAPTAGLHFTPGIMETLEAKRIGMVFVTLHVGPGTFLPVRDSDARKHRIHSEPFRLSARTADAVGETRRRGGRVVAVGTTAARVLEHAAQQGPLKEGEGECDLYVLPGHRFRCVDALITNFHLPRSTLLLFVCAFAGRESVLHAYGEALARDYRFTSYGDAMILL
jgi:S-adenosylmethionine:tRNA ribosyltransferase-isomerase